MTIIVTTATIKIRITIIYKIKNTKIIILIPKLYKKIRSLKIILIQIMIVIIIILTMVIIIIIIIIIIIMIIIIIIIGLTMKIA